MIVWRRITGLLGLAACFYSTALLAQSAVPANPPSPAALRQAFVAPPASARPWVYWFWSDGNLNREGITADLEAMARVGIGGVLIMEVDQGIPPGPARFMSPPWRDQVRHVLKEAARLGLEINLNNDGGWCGSGGPWVRPEHAMQRVTHTETVVRGPGRWQGTLRRPPATADYYRDIAVLAIPSPATPEPAMSEAKARFLSGSQGGAGKSVDATAILDGNPETSLPLSNPAAGKPHVLSLVFPKPVSACSFSMQMSSWNSSCDAELFASTDGTTFRSLRTISARWPHTAVNFPRVEARHFRIVIKGLNPPWAGGFSLGEVALHGSPRIEELAGKAAFVRQDTFAPVAATAELAAAAIPRSRVVDLTARMTADGRLAWDVPEGSWTILRLGHTPTGAKNAPAPKESIGLECDKLSREAVEAHFNAFVGRIDDDQKSLGVRPLVATHIDSWEVGSQNWTPRMAEEFHKRRRYDLRTLLPALSGRVVESVDTTERFLFDLRTTIGELAAENYAGHMRELANRRGLRLSIEAYGDCVFDNLAYAGRCDEPMCEFWVGGGALELGKAMSSAAHAYGLPVVGAEAFTAADTFGKWQNHPYSLKPLGDAAFCSGVNRFVFHRYAMQPWVDRKPGMTMGPWGTHYERTVTWWDYSPAWHAYLSRCQHLLRQGRFVADLCYLQSEAMPNGLYHAPRSVYDYDGVPPGLVIESMRVRDGLLELPSGMQYRLLVLPPGETMTPALLAKIGELVRDGATVLGPRPRRSPSLAGAPQCDQQVLRLADDLWGNVDGKTVFERQVAKGRIVSGRTPEQVLSAMGVPPDFQSDAGAGTGGLRAIHRRVGATDLYFVANTGRQAVSSHCTFRLRGRRPEFWHPDTGRIEPVAVYDETAEGTRVPLRLDAGASVFVAFSSESPQTARAVALFRDGVPVVQTDPKAKIVVANAVYGVPGDAARSRNVTAEVRRRVDRGERSFPVAAMAVGGDPAVGAVKTLRVDYTVDGAARTAAATDRDTIHLPAYRFALVVDKAIYGVPGDAARLRDVTGHVRERVERGQCAFPVASMAEYGDPAFMVVKTLRIEYRVDGKPFVVEATDSEDIAMQAPSPPPPARIRVGDDGRLTIETTQSGRFEVLTPAGARRSCTVEPLPPPLVVTGPWDVRFTPGGGAPEKITMAHLRSWSDHPDPRVKYYSGRATYTANVRVPAEWFGRGRRVWLDLGDVRVIATAAVNGHPLATAADCLWKPPFRVDITEALRPGDNQLAIGVVNLWPNRLIGDEQLPDDCLWNGAQLKEYPRWLLEGKPSPTGRLTFATWKHYRKDSPLLPSGLLGPVTLTQSRVATVE